MAPQHIHHAYYTRVLKHFNDRLYASIAGFEWETPGKRGSQTLFLPDIRSRFEPYLGWLERSEVLWLRFEDFISDCRTTVARVFDHAVQRGFNSNQSRDEAISTLVQSIHPQRSPTFRSGKTGAWRTAFTEEHKATFKETSGDLLIKLGYEESNVW